MESQLSLKILIIEDDSVDRQMLRRTLAGTDLSVTIEEVETAAAAIRRLKENTYDLALLDYKLPDGTGISVLKALKNSKSAQTPIIVLTVHAQKKVALEALEEGAQDFLPKDTITQDNLERAIRYAIQRNKLQQELQWSRERERRERELRAFQESVIEFETVSPPAIRESSMTFDQFVADYKLALWKAIEEMSFKVPQQVPDQMRSLAAKLGDVHAGPKDVIDIHTEALKDSVRDKSKQIEEIMTNESRIMLVQLMGYLCRYYRNKNLSLASESLRPKKKQG